MTISRRTAIATLAALPVLSYAAPNSKEAAPMYGIIGKMLAQPGQRDALIAILLEGTASMPGCLGYAIAKDKANADALWITETWDSQASHQASLSLPQVKAAIAKGRSLIAGMELRHETEPVGGHATMMRSQSQSR